MRKTLLSGAAALAFCAGLCAPAQAQWLVTDPWNTAQAVEQVRQAVAQLQVMQQQYQQLQQQYQAIAHLPNQGLQQLGQQFNVSQFRNALPAQSSVLGTVMNGTALGGGAFGSAAQGYRDQNQVYSAPGQDFQARELDRNGQSVAGAQAMAAGLYQSAADRITTLQGLESQLADAPDTKAVADIQARLSTESAYIQAQQVQAQSLGMWQATQERNADQRHDEERRRQVDSLIEVAKARGG